MNEECEKNIRSTITIIVLTMVFATCYFTMIIIEFYVLDWLWQMHQSSVSGIMAVGYLVAGGLWAFFSFTTICIPIVTIMHEDYE